MLLPLAGCGLIISYLYTDECSNPIGNKVENNENLKRIDLKKHNKKVPKVKKDFISSIEESATNTRRHPYRFPVLSIAFSWLFYVVVWHGVLSNIPLSAPMPFAVHSRYKMI